MRGFVLGLVGLLGASGLAANASPAAECLAYTLPEALEVALRRNPQLAAAEQDTVAGRSALRESRGLSFPELGLAADYTRHEEPNIIVPIHEQGVFPPLDDDILGARVDLRVPLFDGGRRGAAVAAARASVAAATARFDQARQSTIGAVAKLFVEARRVDDGLELVTGRLAALRGRRAEFEELLHSGRVAEGDLALIDATLAEIRADSVSTDSGRREIALRLAAFLGEDLPVVALTGPEPPRMDGGTYLDSASDGGGPATRALIAEAERARARHAAARRAFWPELIGFATVQSRSGDDLDFATEWAGGIAMQLPLFTGGRRLAALSTTAARVRSMEYRLEAARRDQRLGEDLARERWRTAAARGRALDEAVRAKRVSVDAQQVLHRAGRLTLSELLVRENELLALELSLAESARVARLALLEQEMLVGTLDHERAVAIVGSGS